MVTSCVFYLHNSVIILHLSTRKHTCMTTDTLYEFITSKMSAEDALKLLLQGAGMQYKKLKFDPDGTPVHPIYIMSMAAMDMGWEIAVESDQENVRGMVLGTEAYLEKILPGKDETQA